MRYWYLAVFSLIVQGHAQVSQRLGLGPCTHGRVSRVRAEPETENAPLLDAGLAVHRVDAIVGHHLRTVWARLMCATTSV